MAVTDANLSNPVWHVVVCLPGLNIDYYIASEREPTLGEITEVWQRNGSDTVPKARGFRGSLADAYPGIALIERLKVVAVAPESSALTTSEA